MTKKILTKRQILFLQKMGENTFLRKNFYLSGGTALAGFYLHHRYSEDLDFFSENEIDPIAIQIFLKQTKKNLKFKKIDFQQSYNRNLFFIDFGDEILKTEFTFFPFPRIEKSKKYLKIEIDSLIDIAVNKLFTIYQRCQARDYIDLYFLCREKKFTIKNCLKMAKAKFDWHIDPLQLGTQFMKASEAKDYPKMIEKIDDQDWQTFFIKEAKKLKEEILTE